MPAGYGLVRQRARRLLPVLPSTSVFVPSSLTKRLNGRARQTEDTGYFYTTDHNYTTPWDFSHDKPTPTHLVIHIGCAPPPPPPLSLVLIHGACARSANDSGQGVAEDAFTQTYLAFLARLRTLYPTQPIFVFTPVRPHALLPPPVVRAADPPPAQWGWPSADAPVSYYYPNAYQHVVDARYAPRLGPS